MLLLFYILAAVILLYSIILHELAHAFAADKLGDPTAKYAGRLTLNPIPHLDPVGTILPLLLMLSSSPVVFGWARPVPINPYNFREMKKGILIVSAAGVAANLFIAWALATIFKFMPPIVLSDQFLVSVIGFAVRMNVVLAVFNLIPIPPLDGSKILFSLLPGEHGETIYFLEKYGFFILLFILVFPPTALLISSMIDYVYGLLMLSIF